MNARQAEYDRIHRPGEKYCVGCSTWKPLGEYNGHPQTNDKLKKRCKLCETEYVKKYQKDRPEETKRRGKAYREKNLDLVRQKTRERMRRPHNKEGRRIASARRNAKKKALAADFKNEQAEWSLVYFSGACAYCRRGPSLFDKNPVLHWDHFIPLDSPDCPGTITTNMLPVCQDCNLSKSHKEPMAWLDERFGPARARKIVNFVKIYFEKISQAEWTPPKVKAPKPEKLMIDKEVYVTVEKAMVLTGYGQWVISHAISDGKLRTIAAGGRKYIERESLDNLGTKELNTEARYMRRKGVRMHWKDLKPGRALDKIVAERTGNATTPHYSTDLDFALSLIGDCTIHRRQETVEVELWEKGKSIFYFALRTKSVAEAICKAWLEWEDSGTIPVLLDATVERKFARPAFNPVPKPGGKS